MRLDRLDLVRYGKFTDRSLDFGAPVPGKPDFHLVYGPNEAGKSTLRQAIGDWLFGFPTRTPMGFVHPMPELRLGGTLQRTADASALAFERTKANKNTLRTPEDALLPDTALAPWLANLQREAYERMYGLDHDRLVAGGADGVFAGGTTGEAIDAAAWLNEHGAANLPTATSGSPAACNTTTAGTPTGVDGDPDRLVDDPTSSGKITARMLHLYQQTLAAFPDTGWGCYSPRPGTKSEHPLGRACDITFGNRIGQRPTPAQLDAGWKVTNWMKDNADVLGVEYLIWQGQIWSVARDAEGWRPYNGGGMHDPASITGGHYDHLHLTVKAG